MTIAFNWANSSQGVASSNSISVSRGSNTITSGDLLIAFVDAQPADFNTDVGTITKPSDWTQIVNSFSHSSDANDAQRGGIFWKVAGSGETGPYTFGWTTNAVSSWALLDYSGTDTSTVTDVTNNTAYTGAYASTFASNAVSPLTQTNDLLILVWCLSGGGTSYSSPGGTNSRVLMGATTSTFPGYVISDKQLTASGSTGTFTMTYNGGLDDYCWMCSTTILTASSSTGSFTTSTVYQSTVNFTA